ncbi:MAG TPA: SDR family oxidoreductase [Candidatus Krumholzibacteria bacterium]|nr:SDR family oxidoreductase [Candidatus Krumholzibacteria bacterium]
MTISLTGRRALVTGASRGIGRAVALVLAAEGARVAVHYGRDERAAEAVRRELSGPGHVCLGCDLGDPAQAAALADRAADALGGLDILVNNAGIYERHDLGEEGWLDAWNRTLQVNLTSAALVIAGALPHMDRAGRGHIVNVSSRGAYRGEPEAPAYGAAKAGLNALSQSLARALAPRNIAVVGVAPGWVLTDMTREYLEGEEGDAIRAQSPAGRVATAAEVAAVVLLAVSGRADALQGAIIDVNCASYLR